MTVEDVDECALDPATPQGLCPGCRPHCHEHAECENRVGTYACKCPICMTGDGFEPFVPRKSGTTPAGYEGGTGCRDKCDPEITLLGEDRARAGLGLGSGGGEGRKRKLRWLCLTLSILRPQICSEIAFVWVW